MEIIKRIIVTTMVAVLLLSIVPAHKAEASSSQAKAVLKIVNKQREKRGIKPLKLDNKLCKAANKRAVEITKHFDHTRPNGKPCYSILKNYKISYGYCGENIAAGQPSAKSVMNSWMHSSGHKKNILNKKYRKLGVGYKKIKKGYRYYWVQIFTD